MRGVLIRDGWWKVVDVKDEDELKERLDATEIERVALKVGDQIYGCACDADARSKTDAPETIVMRIKKKLSRKYRYFGYVAGPVFIYLNKGLDPDDISFITARLVTHSDKDRTPCLIVDDYRNVAYEGTDP